MKPRLLRYPILGVLALASSLLSCGREVTGPGAGRVAGAVQLRPVFTAIRVSEASAPVSVSGLVEFVRVRVVLLRANGDTALQRVVEFPADSQSISLTLPVVLSASAGAEGEALDASLRFVNAAGDTVFRGGPIQVQARPAGAPPVTPPEIPLAYTGPGATAASIAIAPRTHTGGSGGTTTFSATVRDAQGSTLANTPVAFLSSDSTMVSVGLRTGVATLRGLKGQATIYATTLTGQRDSALVTVIAPPSQLAFLAPPTAVTAGATLPAIRVAVLDAARDTVRGFVGTMRVALTGGTSGATLGGTTRVAVEGGIARFADLSVDRAGSGYRLVATLDSAPTVPAVTSDAFTVAPGAPAAIVLVAGGGQTIPQGVPFPDSVVVRVTDRFGTPVPNALVRFEVVAGQGGVEPPTVTTPTTGVAATRWTAGVAGTQQLRVRVDTLSPLTVEGTALPSNGPPLLYVGTTVASLGVGRTLPITAYLSNPARATTPITLRSRNDSIAQWTTTSTTIPLNGTQGSGSLTGRRLGSTWVVLESTLGTDSVRVTVDSTAIRFGPLPAVLSVSDTIRTTIVLDAPAPTGGLTVTVRSADSARVRVAPGSGTGLLEQPESCLYCSTLRAADESEGQLLAPPAGTATLTVPAGQLSAQLVVLPVAPATDSLGTIALTASAAGLSSVVTKVLPTTPTLSAECFYCTIAVGHQDGIFLGTTIPLRRPLTVRIATVDAAVLQLMDSTVTLAAGQTIASLGRVARGRAAGTGRLVVSAAGFQPDTVTVTVRAGAMRLFGYNGVATQAGSQLDLRAAFGWESSPESFTYGAPRADSLPVTLVSSDTSVVQVDFTQRTLAAGAYEVRLPVVGRRQGNAILTVTAPGYPTFEAAVQVVGDLNYLLQVPAQSGIGVVTPIALVPPSGLGARLGSTEFTLTSSDTTVLRVLTPRVTLSSTADRVDGLVEGLTPGAVTLTLRRDGSVMTMAMTQVVPSTLVTVDLAERLEAGASSEVQVLMVASEVRMPTAPVIGVLRSSDPAVLQVTDSLLRFVPGTFGAIGVARGIGAGTATLTASVPGFPATVLGTITVSAPRLVLPVTGTFRPGPGIEWQIPVERQTASLTALPFTVSVSGSGGSSVVTAADSFPAGQLIRTVRLRGGNATGTDTLRVSATGLTAATLVLPAAPSWFTVASEATVPVEVAFAVGGGLAMAPGFVDDSLLVRPVAATALRYRLVSLDTGIVRVIEDTLVIEPGVSFATRLAKARGLRPGVARLTATRLGSVGPVVDTVVVEVAPARLSHNVPTGALRLGMQQRTEDTELYIARQFSARTPTWVRLTSSAPGVVTVPDSVLIPADQAGAHLVVTARDTVGMALITARATGHEGASFTVTVTRAQLLGATSGALVTGGRIPFLIVPVTGSLDHDAPTVRPHTAPLPLRVRSGDATVARWVSDSLMLATGGRSLETTLEGGRVGTTTLTLEDRRTSFVRLTPVEGTIEVAQGMLQVTAGYETFGGMPLVQAGVGLTSYPREVEIETNGRRAGLVVRFRSLRSRMAFVPDTLVLSSLYEDEPLLRTQESVGVRGIAAGVDTVEVSAVGHRPDTVLVRVDRGYLASVSPLATTTLVEGDSALIRLAVRSPSGDSAMVATEMTLTLTASPTLSVRLPDGSGSTTTLTLPAGATEAAFWVKGVSPGTSKLTLTAPSLRTFELQGIVRARATP